jgi:hypothetical protein
MINESVSHRERRSPQKMGFIDESARLSESQVGLMYQRRGLQGLPCAKTCAGSLRYAPELLVEGRKQLSSDTTHFGRRRAGG